MPAWLTQRTHASQKPSDVTLCCAASLKRQDGSSRARWLKRRACTIWRVSEGITTKVFGTLNELAIEAMKTRSDRITDEAIEAWKPAVEKEAAFA